MKTFIKSIILVPVFAGITACGGGSDTVSSNPPPVDAAPQDVFVRGPIANFGSIIVNGVRYDTDDASFDLDGSQGSQSDLRVGYVVSIDARINSDGSRTATRVFYDDLVKGPVESIDLIAQRLVVLGQTVDVTDTTSFDDGFSPASLDGVQVGQIVEVSGQFDASGSIVATRIEPKPDNTEWEVQGVVAQLDEAAATFTLNSLVVDYSTAMLDDFDDGQIRNGDFVEAKGSMFGANGELIAREVEEESRFRDSDEDDYVEIEGLITRFASSSDFDVSGQPVTTNASTVFENGSASDLGLNLKVEVDGFLDTNGVLVAEKVELRRSKNIRIESSVDAIDAAAGTITLLGITVNVDMSTRMEDKTDADLSPFNLSDISVGDFVEIRGSEFPAGSGEIIAQRLERDDLDDESTLQGNVAAIDEPTFEILGVTVQTDGRTEFEDESDRSVSGSDFFAQLTINRVVKAKGIEIADGVLLAEEVETEDDDD